MLTNVHKNQRHNSLSRQVTSCHQHMRTDLTYCFAEQTRGTHVIKIPCKIVREGNHAKGRVTYCKSHQITNTFP